jgi:hypothetical protein
MAEVFKISNTVSTDNSHDAGKYLVQSMARKVPLTIVLDKEEFLGYFTEDALYEFASKV